MSWMVRRFWRPSYDVELYEWTKVDITDEAQERVLTQFRKREKDVTWETQLRQLAVGTNFPAKAVGS